MATLNEIKTVLNQILAVSSRIAQLSAVQTVGVAAASSSKTRLYTDAELAQFRGSPLKLTPEQIKEGEAAAERVMAKRGFKKVAGKTQTIAGDKTQTSAAKKIGPRNPQLAALIERTLSKKGTFGSTLSKFIGGILPAGGPGATTGAGGAASFGQLLQSAGGSAAAGAAGIAGVVVLAGQKIKEHAMLIGKIAVALVTFTVAIFHTTKALGSLNASIATTNAMAEVRQIQRGIRSGAFRAAAFRDMSDVWEDLQDIISAIADVFFVVMVPILKFVANILVGMLAILVDIADIVTLGQSETVKHLQEVVKAVRGSAGGELPVDAFLRDIATGNINKVQDPLFRFGG